MFSKINVNGPDAIPLYKWLRANSACNNCIGTDIVSQTICKSINFIKTGKFELDDNIPWNFSKFLIDYEGNITDYYPPKINPK